MRPGTCKHFNGAHHNECCEAGVRYSDVTPDWDKPGRAIRLPCRNSLETYTANPAANESLSKEFAKRGTCPKYAEPTAAEIAEDEAETERLIARMMAVGPTMAKIKKEHAGQNWSGVLPCPVCGKANLHVVHVAYNGHVRAKCETADCVNFME
jgi:hypothetical protein